MVMSSSNDNKPSTSLAPTLEILREEEEQVANNTISSENSDDDFDDDNNKKNKSKKRHRHTAEQIREMEALFKESPHPDKKQRQQLSKRLGLHPRQVNFWFQNHRNQIMERHEKSLLKSEMDKLHDENKLLRETITCPNYYGFGSSSKDAIDEHQLRIENAKLKAEIEKLRTSVGKYPSPTNSGNEEENRSSLEKSRIMEIVNLAMEELVKMASTGEPLWIRSFGTGREILNYNQYLHQFPIHTSSNVEQHKRCIEASRDSGLVLMDLPQLVQSFMDVKKYEEMFGCMISKAATLDVICNGEGANRNGAVQLMFAELQMPTPWVSSRQVYFVRYSKQLKADKWAIVDVSIDNVENNIDVSLAGCRKRPSGCILEETSIARYVCEVTWIEHLECQKSISHSMYRAIISSGLAFGARHWMATLQQECERLVFFHAKHVKASTGISTLVGWKSILKLAQRMTWSFGRALGSSSHCIWKKVPVKTGADDVRMAYRTNLNDPGEPLGLILCAVSSIWLPVSRMVLFDFLRDQTQRNELDIMSNGGLVQSIANLEKGLVRGNTVSVHTMKSKENMWMLQDSCTNSYESMVICAPVGVSNMQSVMAGSDSTDIVVLPSGFSILPDAVEARW